MKTVFESTKLRPLDKRKRKKNNDPADIDGFLGPWGGYIDEQRVAKPTEEEAAELESLLSKRNRPGKPVEDKPIEEKTTLHSKRLVRCKIWQNNIIALQLRMQWIIKDVHICIHLWMLVST